MTKDRTKPQNKFDAIEETNFNMFNRDNGNLQIFKIDGENRNQTVLEGYQT